MNTLRRWIPYDTEKRLDFIYAGCKTIEEAAIKFPLVSEKKLLYYWGRRRLGLMYKKYYPDLFNKLHQKWQIEYIRNGNVISKDVK